MATITIRVTDDVRDEVEGIARGRGVSVSDLVRTAIDDVLGRDVDRGGGGAAPVSLSVVQRQTLQLQHRILDRLGDDENVPEGHHQKMATVLEEGFAGEYYAVFSGLREELTQRECALVWDLLDMFRHLRISLQRLSRSDRAELAEHSEHALVFRGLDFNDAREARLATYAEYLINDGRWEELAEQFDAAHELGNSHSPTLASYERMLRAFTPIWKQKTSSTAGGPERYQLTVTELNMVVAAWPSPR